ncbi:molybdopterin-dependent oxidoreductase [Stieleria sp. TO1_6]|uniref:molybdopterin-dependent oxidoreductase n=1 Tax=Stieleria tagensis TaxID=2956795 RepID=UPI00209AABBE|nr:molybdopterin-dependent oxidoreductase [Stieleria tagensis]MCO8121908.1 molybdopterin-dependent oxidoreductase [Stieleria tagensis]
MDSKRRSFLKSAAMAAAGSMVVSDAALSLPVVQADDGLPDGDNITWNKAPCRFCGTGCHVQVGVEDGRVIAIAGDKAAEVNKGLLCVKGYHVGGVLYGKDRLTEPLRREGDKFVPIPWDEAIDIVAQRIMKAPEKFAFYGSGQWTIPEGYAAQKFMKGGLSNNHIDPNARLCMASAVTGFLATYGVDEPAGCYDDLDKCDVLITWGNNPAEMHPVLFSRVTDRRSKGEKVRIIDIGTRRTRTTDAANDYLEMKPHGDVAISLGIMQQLIANDNYDKDFVSKHCAFRAWPDSGPSLHGDAISEQEFRKRIAKYTPEHVEELSGLPADKIRMLAALFADRELRITSLWCMGMNQHTMGTAVNSLVHGVHLLSGHFGRPGDAPTSLTGQPSACGTVREVGTLSHALPGGRLVEKPDHREQCETFWNVPAGRIKAQPGYHTVKMFEQFVTPAADGGDIETLLVQVTNPGQSLPNLNKLFNKKDGLEDKYLIVSDVYPTATTRLADLILPAAMWVEKNGVFGNSERRTQQWFKMVDPPGQARDDCWMTIAIAHRLFELGHEGMKDKDGEFIFAVKDDDGKPVPVWEFEHYYDVNVDKHLFEEYRQFTTMKHKNLAPYDEYVKARGLRWPVVEQDDGSWRETRFRFSGFDDPFVAEGKEIDFYHSTSNDGRAQIWVHEYQPPPEVPDSEYPMWLCTGRVLEHWHTGSMTRRLPPLNRAMPTAYVEMHAQDARDRNIRQGETVVIESRRGETQLPVWIDGRGRPPQGTLFVPFFDESKLINDVTLEDFDPLSKQPDYKKCAARVRKLGEVAS